MLSLASSSFISLLLLKPTSNDTLIFTGVEVVALLRLPLFYPRLLFSTRGICLRFDFFLLSSGFFFMLLFQPDNFVKKIIKTIKRTQLKDREDDDGHDDEDLVSYQELSFIPSSSQALPILVALFQYSHYRQQVRNNTVKNVLR